MLIATDLWDCKVWGWSSGRICCGVKKTSRCTTQRQRSQVDAIGVWVYSCGSRVNEGEMEKHQEDHAAAMERLYSPQRSMDIIMSSAPCSFLHCLIVEVLPLLTSKHFITKPLAQLFGFFEAPASHCLHKGGMTTKKRFASWRRSMQKRFRAWKRIDAQLNKLHIDGEVLRLDCVALYDHYFHWYLVTSCT